MAVVVPRHLEQQMTMARPWDAAEPWSIWEITGEYPGAGGTFTACLAVVLPRYVHGTARVLFVFIGELSSDSPVNAEWITQARPLLLVDRDDPGLPYWADDQAWLDAAGGRA